MRFKDFLQLKENEILESKSDDIDLQIIEETRTIMIDAIKNADVDLLYAVNNQDPAFKESCNIMNYLYTKGYKIVRRTDKKYMEENK